MGSDKGGTILEFVLVGVFLVILAVFAIILSPILVPYFLFVWIREKLAERSFKRYLEQAEGTKYFCYTNRHTSEKYVQDNIVPCLGDDVKILHISDKYWESLRDESEFPIRVVWSMKTVKGGFPYVSKVVNGELVTESINQQLYSAITRKAEADGILRRIEKFYS